MPTLSDTGQRPATLPIAEDVQPSLQSDAGARIAASPPVVRRFSSDYSTPMLDRVWHLSRQHRDTCFLINRTDLPDELARQFTEKRCLVVPAKTRWDIAAAVNSADASIGYAELALQSAETNQLKAVLALDHKTVLIDFDALRERVFQMFEAELPIVYKSRAACALAVHPYHPHQLDLMLKDANASLGTDWHDAGLSFEDEIRRRLRSNLPRNAIVVTNCIDMADTAEHY